MAPSIRTFRMALPADYSRLPPDALTEIADFIYFVRKRVLQPQSFEEERRDVLLRVELRQFSLEEEAHLEKEFEDYDKLYPRE